MNISFAYTTPALVAGAKTVTRRDWNPEYAVRFHAGDLVAATSRSTRFGGTKVATIRLTADPVIEPIERMPDADYDAEGFRWLHDHPDRISSSGRAIFGTFSWDDFERWRASGVFLYVVRFELVDVSEAPIERTREPRARPARENTSATRARDRSFTLPLPPGATSAPVIGMGQVPPTFKARATYTIDPETARRALAAWEAGATIRAVCEEFRLGSDQFQRLIREGGVPPARLPERKRR